MLNVLLTFVAVVMAFNLGTALAGNKHTETPNVAAAPCNPAVVPTKSEKAVKGE